jgi:hypothetical protein
MVTSDRGFEWTQELTRWMNADNQYLEEIIRIPISLSNYDVVFVYCHNNYTVERLIPLREQNPHIKIIIVTDNEWQQVGCGLDIPPSELLGLKCVDLIFSCSYLAHKYLIDRGFPSVYTSIMKPYFSTDTYIPPLLSYEERLKEKRGVGVYHSYSIDNQTNIFNFVRKLGLKPLWRGNKIAGNMGGKIFGEGLLENEFVDWTLNYGSDYNDMLNQGLIGFVDGYSGVSRFAHECAILGVPVVGTKTAYLLNEYYPEFSCEPGKIDTLYDITVKLINDRNFYDSVVSKAQKRASEYYKEDVSKKRFLGIIKQYLCLE